MYSNNLSNDPSSYSSYQPSGDVKEFTKDVQHDYSAGIDILNKPYVELNMRSVIDDENRGQLMFNAFVDTTIEDESQAWKWRGTRSMARNKGIAMHANLAANYLIPLFMAQNEDDEVDKDFSEVMRDIVEWMCLPTNSNYQSSFLQMVFAMETNPVTFLGAEYCEVFQTIREKTKSGKYTTKQVLDSVLSGFKAPIYSSKQILITNAYERNTQKQRRIIKRRWVEREELEAKYGQHPNWGFVKTGIQSVYNAGTDMFHDCVDMDYPTLVAEETAYSRRDDSEVCFVNGIYLGATNVEDNPIKHRELRTENGETYHVPKYNVIPFGFHRIGEHFFYYKSMMNALGWDNAYYDAMTEVVMNRALLEVEMPVAISGSEKIDSDVIFPNSVVTFTDKDTKVQQLLPNSNMNAGFKALEATDESISKGSVSDTVSGQLPDASQKAFTVGQAAAASKKLIGAVGKSLGESIVQYGDLMKDIAINHITVPQVEELTGGQMKLKYRSFILPNKGGNGGKMMDKKVKFDESLIGVELSKQEKEKRNIKLLEESGYPENTNTLSLVNPELFGRFRYLSKVDLEEMFVKDQNFWQPVLLNLKTALMNDPTVDQEYLTKKVGYAYFQSDGDGLLKKQAPVVPGQMGPDGQPIQPGANEFGNRVKTNQLASAASGVA